MDEHEEEIYLSIVTGVMDLSPLVGDILIHRVTGTRSDGHDDPSSIEPAAVIEAWKKYKFFDTPRSERRANVLAHARNVAEEFGYKTCDSLRDDERYITTRQLAKFLSIYCLCFRCKKRLKNLLFRLGLSMVAIDRVFGQAKLGKMELDEIKHEQMKSEDVVKMEIGEMSGRVPHGRTIAKFCELSAVSIMESEFGYKRNEFFELVGFLSQCEIKTAEKIFDQD